MAAYQEVVDYLQAKVKKTNLNNKKANTGGRILKSSTEIIPDIAYLVDEAAEILRGFFHKEDNSSGRGQAALTYASHAIGRMVANTLALDLKWNETVRLGDLFVEGFYTYDYVDLYYEQKRESKHLILITPKFSDPLREGYKPKIRGSSRTKPEDIYRMEQVWQWEDQQERKASVIKNKTPKDTHIIRHNRDEIWLKSINKLQQMPWQIDERMIKAVRDSDILAPDTDDMDLIKSWQSKCDERDAIVEKAELMKGEIFYQYISTDYRGRLYYEEPYLNFQGSDRARGMLKFGKGKRLADNMGDWWLAVHTAASYNESYSKDKIPSWCEADYAAHLEKEGLETISLDKMTLQDRVNWVNQNMDRILEWANNNEVRDEAEKKFSFLACCYEWQAYNKNRDHISYLPIPVDGSNNGWQHLGAISKDTRTAGLVGLSPVEIQSDFYVQTAKKLFEITTDERRKELLASMPMKHIRKGISKRGSMTRAYSAGAKKIGENMWLDCRQEGFNIKYGITEEDCYGFAGDLIKAIEAVCPGPLETMKYLQDLAQYEIGIREKHKDGVPADKEFAALRKKVNSLWDKYNQKSKSFDKKSDEYKAWYEANEHWRDEIKAEQEDLVIEMSKFETVVLYGNNQNELSWKTPSGFPVEYKAFAVRPVNTLGAIAGYDKYNDRCQVKHIGQEATEAPDINKFVCGVSPNFIHSLDASHMSRVINHWHGQFGAVHDSFSTHACDVEDLVALTKDEFVKMYNEDNYFDKIRYQLTCNTDDVKQPELGELDITEVYGSDYFFA